MLSPVDPLERANMLELVYTIACDIHPLQNLRVLQSYPETDRPTRANQVITEGLATFEALLRGGKYCVGDTVTLADVVLVPQVYNAIRWGVEMKNFPKINKIVDHLRTLPPFLAAHPDSQPDSPNHQK
jgi:maleylacetoacetate isomerase